MIKMTACVYDPSVAAIGATWWYFRLMEPQDFFTINDGCEKRKDGAGWNYWRSAEDPQPGEAFIALDLGCAVNVSSVALKNVYNYEPDWAEM